MLYVKLIEIFIYNEYFFQKFTVEIGGALVHHIIDYDDIV